LKPDERELRLQLTDVEWYVSHLMQMPASDRTSQLLAVPEAERQMVGDRLATWDRLTPEQRQIVLNYMQSPNTAPLPPPVPSDEKARENLNRNLEQWKRLPPDQRLAMFSQFRQFFELTPDERERTLHTLSDPERRQMEKALARFDAMPKERRTKLLAALPRLAGMSDQERVEFLQNAESWEKMTPAERLAWRTLVTRLPPPPIPPPPLPPGSGSVNMPRRSLAPGHGNLVGTNPPD
jgi:hypothetical protein